MLPPNSDLYDEGDEFWKEEATEPDNLESVVQYLEQVIEENTDDLNFPGNLLASAAEALEPGVPPSKLLKIARAIRAELKLAEENSPYPEVRAIVDAFDDPKTPVTTFRMWFIGLLLVIIGTGVNQFFAPRLPSISLSITFAQLISYPMGRFLASVLPTRIFRIRNYSFSLNPGPFNMKEHMLISIMANVSFGGAYVTDIIAVYRIKRFYNNEVLGNNLGFQITMAISSQMMGYTLAGLVRRFLVYPSTMVWWGNLVEISVLRALHSKDDNRPANGWKISQMRFFALCMICYGIYFILPDVFFQSLSFFNWTTWIAPNNVKLAMITGTVSGLGLNPFPTLDWNFLYVNPVVTPLWSIINLYVGALGGFLAICLIFFTNTAYTMYLPINTNGIFDRFGKRFNASRVLNDRGILDQGNYEAYSPPYMSAASIVTYTAFFALYTSTVGHSLLFYRKHLYAGFADLFQNVDIKRFLPFKGSHAKQKSNQTKPKIKSKQDIHCRLMMAYPEVPQWWFLTIGIISTAMAIFMVEYYETQMPLWGLAFAFAIALLLIIPIGIMGAVASISAPLNVLSELVGGYALAGRPLGNMLFKTYGYITAAQALGYASDLKLAHYVKIPPRASFAAQTIGTALSALVSIAVLDWQIDEFADLCSPTQRLHFTCPGYNTFFSSSIIWGAVGPYRLFTSSGAIYGFCMYGFLIGAVLPFIPWLALKKWPRSWWRLVHTPVILAGFLSFAPTNLGYLTPAIPIAILFQRHLKFRYAAWYEKYALTLTAGLSAGVALFGLLYFFAFQLSGKEYNWVGNTQYSSGCDGKSCRLIKTPPEGFGPTKWV
ncbi:OPT family small oligopeptide transporter [Phakopsora pachyrhizi]|uniref:OPT family small oligopeptide transporter n=1 Tax=Phakopsora pachyrhizi TaxID=170000 RepID=A0AAV0B5S1_PHAPC|nr:OPT family small oligopeptide transporter [Phakopsora pachyrhizi]